MTSPTSIQLLCAVFAAVAGCSSSLKTNASCSEVKSNVRAVLVAKEPALAGIEDGYLESCKKDGWSDAAKGCYATPLTYEQMVVNCPPLLSKDQRRSVMNATVGPGTGDEFVK
jgi:hypothetical protein